MTPEQFSALRRGAVQRFVQSALIIDDEATLNDTVDEAPRAAAPPQGSVLDKLVEPVAGVPAKDSVAKPGKSAIDSRPLIADAEVTNTVAPMEEGAQAEVMKVADKDVEAASASSASPLNAKALTDAFLSLSVICGVFRPTPTDNPVSMSSGSAAHADIVIVDWFLTEKNPINAKAIIVTLLSADAASHGRLRLVVVYTNNPGREAIAAELLQSLDASVATQGKFQVEAATTLVGRSTRIVIVNKPGTFGATETVEEAALPARLIAEFARLTDGLLRTFAVSAVAVVRDAVPHVLSLFDRDLDGAYLGHRSALSDPDDALNFATELVTDELRSVIANFDVAERYLGVEVLRAWVDSVDNHDFTDTVSTLSKPSLKQILEQGEKGFAAVNWQNSANAGQAGKRAKPRNISRFFYKSEAEELKANKRLARLTAFRNEAHGPGPLPQHWAPYLSLGSVLRPLDVQTEDPGYLVCLQPGCDSVRLGGPTAFPFQTAWDAPTEFNVIIKHDETDGSLVRVDWKPRDGVMIRFAPNADRRRVLAELDPNTKHFIFTDEASLKYRWIGDLKPLKAQSIAGHVGSRMQGVALDDLEWVRRQTED